MSAINNAAQHIAALLICPQPVDASAGWGHNRGLMAIGQTSQPRVVRGQGLRPNSHRSKDQEDPAAAQKQVPCQFSAHKPLSPLGPAFLCYGLMTHHCGIDHLSSPECVDRATVEKVHDEVDQRDKHGGDDRAGDHDWKITCRNRFHQKPAKARPGKSRLYDDRPLYQSTELQSHHGNDWNGRIFERMQR